MNKLKTYPIIEYTVMPAELRDDINEYCRNMDLHPHNGTYVDYEVGDVEFPHSNSALECWFYIMGIREEHEKVLIHYSY